MLPYPTIAFNGKIYYEASKKTEYDVIIVTGDAYVDHAAFPTAVIFRTLEYLGLSVAIIAQPNINNNDEFTVFKEPKLFFQQSEMNGIQDSLTEIWSLQAHMEEVLSLLLPKIDKASQTNDLLKNFQQIAQDLKVKNN